jgi:hypothetical protein
MKSHDRSGTVWPAVLVAGLLALLGGTPPSTGQTPDFGPPPGPPDGGPPGGGQGGFRFPSPPLLDALDLNHDGQLDAQEIARATAGLKTLDKNHDGQLTADELRPSSSRGRRRPGGFGPPGGLGGPPGGPGSGLGTGPSVLARFDRNKDGMLDKQERADARAYLKATITARGPWGMGGPRGPGGPPGMEPTAAAKPGRRLSPGAVAQYSNAGLYDAHVLRTLFFVFDNDDWEQELEEFHNTDVEVPAQLTVDGKTYPSVGVRFRGMSSYMGVPRGKKRSMNVSLDLVHKNQRLLGYKTLNLLNSHTDPSLLRTVLFDRVARSYIPTPDANLVRVVINGECWGIYVNEEQFDKDFVARWFGENDGRRWKVPPNFSGAAALVYHGAAKDPYRRLYELKSKEEDRAWRDLIELCRQLQQTPDDAVETRLDPVLVVDRALWFLAVDNVFMDDDGYFSRGSDYSIYQDTVHGRFHLLPRDSNETFRLHGGGPPGGPGGGGVGSGFFSGPGSGRRAAGGGLDPLSQSDSPVRPVIRRLLGNPHLRARYLAHVRTIVEEWLDWRVLGPIFEQYRALIAEDVLADTRSLSSFADFFDSDIDAASGGGPMGGGGGIRRFVEDRRMYLLEHPALAKPRPTILAVELASPPRPGEPIPVRARLAADPAPAEVLLYWAAGRLAPFQCVAMQTQAAAAPGVKQYSATIPAAPAGTSVCYYVEARAEPSLGTTDFFPARAEMSALRYRIETPAPDKGPTLRGVLVVNEIMASNTRTIRNPRGKFADWIELANVGPEEVDLSGLHLSDDKVLAHKWTFPLGTKLRPGEYLIVWADEDVNARQGLHANFKLSKQGECVLLTDRDAHGGEVLEQVEFGPQPCDVSYGRNPDGRGRWQPMSPSPGRANSVR